MGTEVLKWSIRSGEQKPAAERLLQKTVAQIEDLFGSGAAKVEDWPKRDRIEERARSLRIEVEMMEESLSKAEQCEQRRDDVGKHVQLQTVLALIKNSIEPNSDLFRRAGRIMGATDADFPRMETSDEIDKALSARADAPTGGSRWTATHYELEYDGIGASWHDHRALICGADRHRQWHHILIAAARRLFIEKSPRFRSLRWSWTGSNRRPLECDSSALPIELQPLALR